MHNRAGNLFQVWPLGHMIKDCPSVALRNERKGVPLNNCYKPKSRQHVPMRVYAVTQKDIDADAPGTEEAGTVTSIFLRPTYCKAYVRLI